MSDDDASRARFEFLPADEREPAIVWAAGDIDLTNVGRFQATLDVAAAVAAAFIVDLTAVTYCDSATIRVGTTGSVTETLLNVSGVDQIASVVTPG